MKTPDTKSRGLYSSREEYFETIEKLWTAMTFCDGNSALNPKCPEPQCNQVLWPVASGDGRARCWTRECERSVALLCSHRMHNKGLCGTCASRYRKALMGPPGSKASTHIYDTKVKNIGSDGRIFLEDLQSRRPPQVAIHWRTTNRLASRNLVALVKLSGRGAALFPNDKITWASVVAHDDSKFEDRHRQAGKVAVLLSEIASVNAFTFVQPGDDVAIVDCLTFVPEYIPVLKALAVQKGNVLPFNDGELLNLAPHDPMSIVDFSHVRADSEALHMMIQSSTLDPIIQIRRDVQGMNQLHSRLLQLLRKLTLDPGQRSSFLEALTHQEQENRTLVLCPSVGSPPILVLSYKNHAIDEFLKDLVRGRQFSFDMTDKLIRIGNCNEPELDRYSERKVFSSQKEVVEMKNQLEDLRKKRGNVHNFLNTVSPLVTLQYNLSENTKKESTNAAIYVQAILAHVDFFDAIREDAFVDSKWTTLFNELQSCVIGNLNTNTIKDLMEGIAHYPDNYPTAEVIWKWMTGFIPLRRCSFEQNGNRCESIVLTNELHYCDDHICNFGECISVVSANGSPFCCEHGCKADGCCCVKLPNQVYCENHACFVCLKLNPNEVAYLAEDEPPNHSCTLHPLCQYCSNRPIEGSDYCSDHQRVSCQGKNKKGQRCKAKVNNINRPYCRAHLSQYVELKAQRQTQPSKSVADSTESEDNDPNDGKYTSCIAKTRRGKLCKAKFSPQDLPYCQDHKPSAHAKQCPQDVSTTENLSKPREDEEAFDQESERSRETIPLQASVVENNANVAEVGHQQTGGEKSSTASDADSDEFSDDMYEDAVCDHVIYDNNDEMEESEHLQHLRDVFGDYEYQADENQTSNTVEETKCDINEDISELSHKGKPPSQWSWSMQLSQRLQELTYLEAYFRAILSLWMKNLARDIEIAQQKFYEAEVKAKSRVYEGKAIIGGTIVGCISRLEAIRSTNPFAIVIEEASEVVEPLLFACLGPTTRKLEMIGDHLQLKPGIQSKFNFERINKIGCSMFERLIRAPSVQAVPSSVLAIQRRMRKNICDLTRGYYTDITIKDHSVCGTKTLPQSKQMSIVKGSGREVPGILPHLYFWSHNGRQQFASVGLSKTNPEEAEMVIALAQYLVSCHIPLTSIAILTPYKGQLMAIRKRLLHENLLGNEGKGGIILSTVDRFQGDEADIVIASLVIDSKSHTPFVKLVNRMIVLLSRARIGMYIIGNIGYFEQSKQEIAHWQNTLTMLRSSGENDSAVDNTLLFDECRVGPKLPICCPIHTSESVVHASRPEELKLGFCNVMCNETLPCSHPCGLRCHWPTITHNKSCPVVMIAPCTRHSFEITCSKLYSNCGVARAPVSVGTAIELYKCQERVKVTLPCSHVITTTCANEYKYADGELAWPLCTEPSRLPFIYPDCKHSIDCKCADYYRMTANPSLAKKCMASVDYVPPCGHIATLRCYNKSQIEQRLQAFTCPNLLDVALPRCGHNARVSCEVAQKLNKWCGERCTIPNTVYEGQSYGIKDHFCYEEVSFVKLCGHFVKVKCEVAFDLALRRSLCSEMGSFVNPICGHHTEATCNLRQIASKLDACHPPVTIVVEGQTSPFVQCNELDHIKCKMPVVYRRLCNHERTLSCTKARKFAPKCDVSITVPHIICGHDAKVLCGEFDVNSYVPWPNQITKSWLTDNIVIDTLPPPTATPRIISEATWYNCKQTIIFKRESTCGHTMKMRCGDVFKLLGKPLPQCSDDCIINLSCGHERTVPCSKSKQTQTSCMEEVQRECWNFNICGQHVLAICSETNVTHCCAEMTDWQCPTGAHTIRIAVCANGIPQDCPNCSMEKLEAEIALTESQLSQNSMPLSEVLAEAFAKLPAEAKSYLEPYAIARKPFVHKFLEHKLNLLQSYQALVEQLPLWEQPLFTPQISWYFVVLEKARNEMKAFDPKTFFTAIGISLLEWTSKNVASVQNKATLLLGVGYSCQTLPPGTKIPKNKKQISRWVDAQQAKGYDAVQSATNSVDKTMFWEPFVIMATHKLISSNYDIEELSRLWPPASELTVQPVKKIEFVTPGKKSAVPKGKVECVDNSALNGTPLEGFQFPCDWDGKNLLFEEVPRSIQLELQKKLQFLQSSSVSPFAGINYLRSLQQTLDVNDFHLLHALELLHLPGDNRSAVQKPLETYMAICQEKGYEAHPLLLLTMARWMNERNYINLFVNWYPNAAETWLKPEETKPQSKSTPTVQKDPSLVHLWAEVSSESGIKSPDMDEMLEMVGISKVKQDAIGLFKSPATLRKMSAKMRKKNPLTLNYCFVGNAGTGKTTVARLFAKFLFQSGLRSKDVFVETNAQSLKDNGTDEFRKLAKSANNGVLFIDEAYDLDPASDFKGRPIVSELLTLAENNRDHLTIILAGYEDDLQEKLFNFNKGLKSRFKFVTFDDFDEHDLKLIWNAQLEQREWTSKPELGIIVAKRLAQGANVKGFAYSRGDFDTAAPELLFEDIVGDHPQSNPKLRLVLNELDAKIGWASIKKSVNNLIKQCEKNYQRQLSGLTPLPIMLNRLFLGNPGTGKTTCAKLYGRILKELQFLSNGDVLFKTASDLVGSQVGESQRKTNECLELARGKVLVIDEAYTLDDNLYGKQALDVLVEKVQNTGFDDLAVLLLGYEGQMLTMLRNQNPGLARRFPRDEAFMFEDYNAVELLQILQYTCQKESVTCLPEAMEKALEILERQQKLANFGNAGAVNVLVQRAIAKASLREGPITLEADDFAEEKAAKVSKSDALKLLDGLYRMDNIRESLMRLCNAVEVAQAEGEATPDIGHFVFRGSPGTGKTTVARVMAKILYQMNLLTIDHVEETSGLELTGEYVGQTKKRVQEKLEAANGGVLFIDEAYELGEGHFGKEAMTTLVAAMTDPMYRGLVIIIAGYPADIDQMLNRNAGLKSRFARYFEFLDWSTTDCMLFMKDIFNKNNFNAEPDVFDLLEEKFDAVRVLPGWGNGRDVKQIWKALLNARASRVVGGPVGVEKFFSMDDVDGAFEEMLRARKPVEQSSGLSYDSTPFDPRLYQTSLPPMEPRFEILEETKNQVKENVLERENDQLPPAEIEEEPSCERDPGVSDVDWEELEAAKKAYAAHLENLKRLADAEKLRQELAKAAAIQERIRQVSPCPVGYTWTKVGGGWRCAGGSHFVTDPQLNAQFTH
ncbi:hypothetical protein THRCLA_21982 [Thraustotheca clavata]|uniref:AAA+ ATPase domain-containing protein n=1 Tax=Thraustotheca clavata TaxID=74557 RepID=A0A1V9ZFP0_9STRA|nr:hypothetical protein THRCLA_21982 [Thraustotheca clavata]